MEEKTVKDNENGKKKKKKKKILLIKLRQTKKT